MQRVLEHRFPQNALLSHDLIEGAYARVGLVTDIEVIEDYPSHYSAYNRRKHRWLRGDWQITSWLLPHVPDETGRKVRNPISLVSQWKILDNLRRSLVEPATFLLFVLSWLTLPVSARNWTISAICILFVPVWFEFFFNLVRSVAERKLAIARDALRTLFVANFNVFLSFVFLAHQMLVSMDAVVRTLVRRMFTRQRLLEWETAAEAEIGGQKRTPVDTYLDWIPLIVVCLAGLVYFVRRPSILLCPADFGPVGQQQAGFGMAEPAAAALSQRGLPQRQTFLTHGCDPHLALFFRVQHSRTQLADPR